MRINELARMLGVSRQEIEQMLSSSDVIELDLNERGARLKGESSEEGFIRIV